MTNPTQPAEGMPERWQLVPVKPTREMLDAGSHCVNMNYHQGSGVIAGYAFRHMLAAAPKAPPMPIDVLKAYMVLSHAQWPMAPAQVRQMRTLLDWLREQGIAPQLAAQGFTKE